MGDVQGYKGLIELADFDTSSISGANGDFSGSTLVELTGVSDASPNPSKNMVETSEFGNEAPKRMPEKMDFETQITFNADLQVSQHKELLYIMRAGIEGTFRVTPDRDNPSNNFEYTCLIQDVPIEIPQSSQQTATSTFILSDGQPWEIDAT